MSVLRLILMVFALCLFILAGIGISHPRANLIGFGLACWVAAELIAPLSGSAA